MVKNVLNPLQKVTFMIIFRYTFWYKEAECIEFELHNFNNIWCYKNENYIQ